MSKNQSFIQSGDEVLGQQKTVYGQIIHAPSWLISSGTAFNSRKIPETAGFPAGWVDTEALRHRRIPEAFPCGKRAPHPQPAGPAGENG